MLPANTPKATPRRVKRPFATLSTPHSSLPSTSSSDSDDDRPHKKLALSLNRLSLSSTPIPEPPKDIEMRQRKSYEKDAFTTVIESLSTTSSDDDNDEIEENGAHGRDNDEAPFPRVENHVSIIAEIEKRLTQFPFKIVVPPAGKEKPGGNESALVLYRSPESMGLPRSERHHAEELKAATRKRILEKRMRRAKGTHEEGDGYEADAEDWEEVTYQKPVAAGINGIYRNGSYGGNGAVTVNGFHQGMHMGCDDPIVNDAVDDEEEDDGEMMDLD